MAEAKPKPWSAEELRAAVDAYLEMQAKARRGERVDKAAYFEALAERFGRSAKAFEYRMQNISAVLATMGRPWIAGLKPASHVGAQVAGVIETLILEVSGQRRVPLAAFETTVRDARGKARADAPPAGIAEPNTAEYVVTRQQRDPEVKAWVLANADGHCERCGAAAPFLGSDGRPFLEVHHVRQLAEGGSDRISNAVALCPNCHRALHYAQDAPDLADRLYGRVERLVKE